MSPWEHFYHAADIGVRGVGHTLDQAFEQAALAMTAVIVKPDRIAEREEIRLIVSAPDSELLLFEWLNALIYEMATRRMLFRRFQVEIIEQELHGRVWGEKIDVQRHQPAVEIKGATFTELKIRRISNGQWLAQCVVDV